MTPRSRAGAIYGWTKCRAGNGEPYHLPFEYGKPRVLSVAISLGEIPGLNLFNLPAPQADGNGSYKILGY